MFVSRTMSVGALASSCFLLLPLLRPPRLREAGRLAGLVDIGGGRNLYLGCKDTGSPVVILEGGIA
jgi:hypothetical protein